MKAMTKVFILFLGLNAVTWIAPQKASAQLSVDFQIFYDDLTPYGNWVDNSDYGYVWSPDVYSGFSPYSTNGHWIYTYAGWTWVSDYSWGWAPFHYGRWFYDRNYGWLWAPDSEWGPGWVSWRRSNDYYGWAPIGPGISFEIAYSNGYNLPYNQWTFVRDQDFGRTNITNYYINNSNNVTIINNTTVINNIMTDAGRNTRYNAGPDRVEVERRAGRTFTPVALIESNKPGQNLSNDKLQIYRPKVEKNNSVQRKPAPSKVSSLEDVKITRQRNDEGRSQKEVQPNKEQPVKQPTREQPVKQQPTREQPVKQQPTREQPVKQQPTREQPVKQQPTREQPVKQQPTREQPVKQQPTREQPAKQQPTREQPVMQPPTREQPVKQQPAKEQPAKQQPAKEQPTKPKKT